MKRWYYECSAGYASKAAKKYPVAGPPTKSNDGSRVLFRLLYKVDNAISERTVKAMLQTDEWRREDV